MFRGNNRFVPGRGLGFLGASVAIVTVGTPERSSFFQLGQQRLPLKLEILPQCGDYGRFFAPLVFDMRPLFSRALVHHREWRQRHRKGYQHSDGVLRARD